MSSGRSKAASPVKRRFTLLHTVYGVEVIDSDGRPVAQQTTELSAGIVAETLNGAAARGPKALAVALGTELSPEGEESH